MQELTDLATLSREFGADLDYIFLGGGNTSFKTDKTLFIKPSGVTLAEIQAEQFLAVDRAALRRVFSESLPDDLWGREAAVKDLMLSAVRPYGAGRPSVEAPLHEIIDYRYVFHLHPAFVNGMTCARDGEDACRRLFPDALWIEFVKPGFTLSTVARERLTAAAARSGRQPNVTFLENHGVFVGADSAAEIKALYTGMMAVLREQYEQAEVPITLQTRDLDPAAAAARAPTLRGLLLNEGQRPALAASGYFEPATGPLSPDHIVYARSFPLVLGPDEPEAAAAVEGFQAERGYLPKVVACADTAVFAVDSSPKAAHDTMIAAEDAALVAQLTAAFGGPKILEEDDYGFIENWEVESYRKKIARAAETGSTRMSGQVCVVTGGAQGFGLGIARGLAAAGGTVVLADMNLEGAQAAADGINSEFGPFRASAVAVNIADEASVAAMVEEVVCAYGGIDLLVANAGVLRAGSVKSMALKDWDFVTNVNYTGYFLCAKYVAQVMAVQNAAGPGPWTDIVQINSKSGLEGSNRNGAYAGSKFGTIGLTQSFAKELVDDKIKVNSICPGNFFDGPLWSDPERGLFVQYLRADKVPGAQTIEDVRRAYEEKVPMGRGCTPEDVVKAILYIAEQDYETGQAIPVTGGQVMLH